MSFTLYPAHSSVGSVGRREFKVKTLRSPLSAEICSHCVLSGGTQPQLNQSEEMKI